MKRLHLLAVAILLVLFAGLGWFFGQKSNQPALDGMPNQSIADGVVQDGSGKVVKYWYDPMVPAQKFDKPGKSPFMDMQLAPKYANSGSANLQDSTTEEAGVVISSQMAQNLGIRLEKVETKSFGASLSALGRVAPDERRFYAVQTRIPGFVERLSVRAVGDPVVKGQKIAEIYAPEILAAQQEYLTLLTLRNIDDDNALQLASRNRLKLLGMSEKEIAAISVTGKVSPRFGIYAPASGVLTELGVREGGQIMAGNALMQISDLSQVWVIAEIPERDAARLKLGLAAEVQFQSLPNEVFKGKVAYLYPMLNDTSRTLQVRIELVNKENRLRPGMYANISFTGQTHEALSVSSESIIATGQRKIVIVKEDNGYHPAEIKTGQAHNNRTEILNGLNEGEQVVTSGQFLIDSEASLSGVLARLSQQDKAINQNMPEMSDKPTNAQLTTLEKMPQGRGKVVEVDTKSGKVVLSHKPIAALGWPAMTMGFKVKNSTQLGSLKIGDLVTFSLKAVAPDKANTPKQYMIEHIEKAQAIQDDISIAKP